MWRTAFLVVWFGCVAHAASRWVPWPEQVLDREIGLLALSALIVVLPWATGPGLLLMLRRMKRGGVNLPHAQYWFEGDRRAASLDRLSPYLDAMALVLTLFLTGILMVNDGATGIETQVLVGTALFTLWGVVWTWRLACAFPRPPADVVKPRGKP